MFGKRKKKENNNAPPPKQRKLGNLYSAYMNYQDLNKLVNRHNNRLQASLEGRSSLDPQLEYDFLTKLDLKFWRDYYHDEALTHAVKVGMPFKWLTSLKGLGEGMIAAGILGMIDDIGSFSNVSKLWRFSGFAVIDGHREYLEKGKPATYFSFLKSRCVLAGTEFIMSRTYPYADIYHVEKERLHEVHPVPVAFKSKRGETYEKYTKGHLSDMARRKMIKVFLQHLWVVWRECEGLDVSSPYVFDVLGHSDYIEPPNWPM